MTHSKQSVTHHWLIPFTILLFVGCSSGPHLVETWRPWNANYGSPESITPGSSVLVTLVEDEGPFEGSQSLRNSYLRTITETLLQRRGFNVVESNPDYTLKIHHKTDPVERQVMATNVKNVNVATAVSTSGDSDGDGESSEAVGYAALGVAIAALVAAAVVSGEKEPPPPSSYTNFQHTVSSSMTDKSNAEVWQGNSFWESSTTDIADEFRLAMLYQLRNFPKVEGTRVEAPKLKPNKVEAYYDMHCRDRFFTSPGVPYNIHFSGRGSIVNNQEVYPAYVDLLQHADICVPTGLGDYADPTEPSLWRTVALSGDYALGSSKEPVTVLILLEADRQGGYFVDRAKIATEQEAEDYRQALTRWQRALAEYYNLYE